MEQNIPELLVKNDFDSPMLFKIYNYLRIIYRNGISQKPLTTFFTNSELRTIIDTLRNCVGDTEFNEKFNLGYCESISKRDAVNMYNRTERTFGPSFTRSLLNNAEYYITPSGRVSKGEIEVLECLFFNYAEQVFRPNNIDEVGFVDEHGVRRDLKKKSLQLETLNKLFCNMGNRIKDNKKAIINQMWNDKLLRKDADGRTINESLPSRLVTDYLGGI